MGSSVITLTPLAQTIPPLFLQDSQSPAQCLSVDLCICFHQLLDKGSVMTIRVVTSLITVDEDVEVLFSVISFKTGSLHYVALAVLELTM